MLNSLKGGQAEMLAMTQCLVLGYPVSLPFGGKVAYDFIADTASGLYRIQVKEIHYGLTSSGNRRWIADFLKPRGKFNHVRRYTKADCDYLIAVCPKYNAFYVFPIEILAAKRCATFYLDDTPSAMNRKDSLWVEPYRDAWP
jgi:hypothetical protein